jgi:hypothetical protein
MSESCTQQDCEDADSGNHCGVRNCPNAVFVCPVHAR